MDGPRPSSATAPSIWYDDVAVPHTKPGGNCRAASGGAVMGNSTGESRAVQNPLLRGLGLPRREVLDLGGHEVRGQALGHVADRGVGDDGDLLDVLVMVAHEAE